MTKYVLTVFAIALAYFSTGYIGLQMPAVGTSITLIWLPTGIAVASLYRFGYRFWPAISVASVCVNLTTGDVLLTCIGIAVGNTLAPLITVGLLHRLKFNRRFERQCDIALLAIAAHLCMLISASTGVAVLSVSARLTDNFLQAWLCWWAGDSMGVIAVAPLLLVASRTEFAAIQKRLFEFASWLILTVLITSCCFVLNDNVDEPAWALAFVPLPLIAWATLRFSATGTSLAIILISIIAAFGTSVQSGPFYREEVAQQIFLLWIYMVIIAILGWLIAALHFAQLEAVNLHKVLEDGLRASEVRYRNLFENNPHPMWVYDLSTLTFLAVNEAAIEHYGYSREEFLAMSIKDIRPPDDVPALLANVAKVSTGLDKAGVWRHRTKAGDTIQVEIVSHVIEFGNRHAELVLANDVTERNQLEEQVFASHQRFQAIVERSHDLILIFDRDGFINFVNPASREVMGYEPEEMIGRHNLCFVAPQDHEPKLREAEVFATNPLVEFRSEIRVQHKNGEWKTLETVGVNLLDVPSLSGMVVNCRDITERKEREVCADNERAFYEMLTGGASLNQILQQITLSCESMSAGAKCVIQGLEKSGDLQQRESAPSWSVPLQSSQGKVLGTLAMYPSEPRAPSSSELATIDQAAHFCVLAIERHEMLDSIRDSQQRLETLVSNLPGMAYRCLNDANWTMSYVSSGCESVTGYLRDDLEQNKSVAYADLIYPDDRERLWSKCQAALDAHVPSSNTYRIIDKSGQIRWVIDRASGVYTENGSVHCIDGFIQDITEARRIEEQVRASLREKEAMLKEIHHRVKNNLQIVTSLLNLQVGIIQDPPVLDALRESQNRIRSMALVHETLYQSSNLGTINLSQYVDALCNNLFRSYGTDGAKVQLQLNVANATLDLERAIPFGLIINELVSNALKYAFPEGRTGNVNVIFGSESMEDYTLRVQDDGVGLPASLDLSQLSSLGLQLVQDLTQQLSGRLTIAQNGGTEFCISFPIRNSNQEY